MEREKRMQEIFNSNIIYQNKNGIEYIQFKKLLEYPELTHCYTLRSNNTLSFPPAYKDAEMLKQSYQKICEERGIYRRLFSGRNGVVRKIHETARKH